MLDGDAAEAHLSGAQRVPDWVPGFCPKVQHHNGNRGARRFPDLRSEGCDEGKGHRESTRTVSTGKTVSQTLRRVSGGTAEVRAPAGAFEDGGGSHTAPPAPPAPARPGAGGGRAPRSGRGSRAARFPGRRLGSQLRSLEQTSMPCGARLVAVGLASACPSIPVWKPPRELSAPSWQGSSGERRSQLGVGVQLTEVLTAFLGHEASHGAIALVTLC